MKDLLTVAKEATSQIKRIYQAAGETPLTDEQDESIKNIVKSTYLKQSFWWKIKNTFESYKKMIVLDIQYNFIGGVSLNTNGNTDIHIG